MKGGRSQASPPLRDPGGRIVNAMTVDVEDYFHVAAFESCLAPADWDRMQPRVVANTRRILALFEARGVRATFFVLGWVAERFPRLVREIHAAGHEIACHGYLHRRATTQTAEEFRADVRRARDLLEDLTGHPVLGYRAPTYSIDAVRTPWAYGILAELGFRYSSSLYPVRHDLYGRPDAPRHPFPVADGALVEIPISTLRLGGRNLPCGGGGYFRLLPWFYSRLAVQHINGRERRPYNFYFHPWEIDPGQPRLERAPWKSRLRHYTNLARMEGKLCRLLALGTWRPMREVYGIE
ncbi:MAG: DUF3473 domain-containing protein [Gammaproteobacteria bacterium]|nr:MAG: DUF3473 domain-containing protein [Gammaproteobacteria bacterium]